MFMKTKENSFKNQSETQQVTENKKENIKRT